MLARVGGMIPARQRSVVVLPAPLGPTSPMTSPGCTSKSSSFTAMNSPYNLVRALTWIIGVGAQERGRRPNAEGRSPKETRSPKSEFEPEHGGLDVHGGTG